MLVVVVVRVLVLALALAARHNPGDLDKIHKWLATKTSYLQCGDRQQMMEGRRRWEIKRCGRMECKSNELAGAVIDGKWNQNDGTIERRIELDRKRRRMVRWLELLEFQAV